MFDESDDRAPRSEDPVKSDAPLDDRAPSASSDQPSVDDDFVAVIGRMTGEAGSESGAPSPSVESTSPIEEPTAGGNADDGGTDVITAVSASAEEQRIASSPAGRKTSSDQYASRIVAFGLLSIIALVSLAIGGTLYLASDPNGRVATPSLVAASSVTAGSEPTATIGSQLAALTSPTPANGATAPANGLVDDTPAPVSTPTPAGNAELDGTLVDAIRFSATLSTPPVFAGQAPIVAMIDDVPDEASSALIQRFVTDDEFTYIVRYFLMPSAEAARDHARLEAGIPTQFEGAATVDDRDISGGACVTVTVLEEMISHCYVLRGRVAVIVEILGPAAARDHIIDAGVTLAGYSREILVRAITD